MLKRCFDIACAVIGLILLAPLGLVLALLVRLSDGGPVFFAQTRIGQFGKAFRIWKFRSMVVNADKIGMPVTKDGDPRITWIGRFLRKTKLDELPQLWNVLVGEMSFVGPRPEVPRYVDYYTLEQREILRLKPGITDLASLLFRDEESLLRGAADVEYFYVHYCLPKKIELNQHYAEHASLRRDVWIILQTLCPYWVGLLLVYAATLTGSLFFACLLRFDFILTRQYYSDFLRILPWMIIPQLVLIFWFGQFRGLLSYFSLPELRQTAAALGLAFLIQMVIWNYISAGYLPARSILPLNLILSLVGVCSVRLFFRSVRERSGLPRHEIASGPWRIAIVGAGNLATKLALDLNVQDGNARRVVAFFDDDPRTWHKRPHDIPVVGMPECLLHEEWRNKIDEVIVVLPDAGPARLREITGMLQSSSLKVTLSPDWQQLRPVET